MINRMTLSGLAAVTVVLFIASALMGQDFGAGNDVLWALGDIVWFGFILCALVLIVLTVGVLGRSLIQSWRQRA